MFLACVLLSARAKSARSDHGKLCPRVSRNFEGLNLKRSRKALAFWCIWQLVMIYLDMYWLVMPSLGTDEVPFQLIDLTCWVGVLALFIAGVAYRAKNLDLLAKNDPRLPDSLAFENI